MSDLFHEAIPDEWIQQIYEVMAIASQHTFQILTKRARRMAHWWKRPVPNIWLGVSVEDQARADERIPWLLKTPAAVRFLSVEPLLGAVDLSRWLPIAPRGDRWERVKCEAAYGEERPHISWVIVGGESGGPPERALIEPCHHVESGDCWHPLTDKLGNRSRWHPKKQALAWVRALRDQCVAARVPFFFKQWGGPTPKSGGRLLDGREWNEYPMAANRL